MLHKEGNEMIKKDLDVILYRTVLTYGIILTFLFILKLFGFDYFRLDMNNEIIVMIDNFVRTFHIEYIWYAITLYINAFCIISITTNIDDRKIKKDILFMLPLFLFMQYLKTIVNLPYLFIIVDFLYLFILSMLYIKYRGNKINKNNIVNYWMFMILCFVFQLISLITRNIPIQNQNSFSNDFIINIIINIDYFVLMLMMRKLYFIKGGKSLWDLVHSYSLDLLTSLKSLPSKLQKSYLKAKPKLDNNTDKLAYRIYLVLFWLYNLFTLFIILFIATLNHTFVECIFIVTSFWINKAVFGKAFHLKKASVCFAVSSLSYYTLNRLTWDIGISFIVPISLGIVLSYVTSKLMFMQEHKQLYRGMDLDDFYETITKVTSNNEHIEICKMFYVDKQPDVKIAFKYNYSVANIKKIKQKINKRIREL